MIHRQFPVAFGYIGYLVGSEVYWRPDGVVHLKVPSGNWSTFHLGCCLTLWSCLHWAGVAEARPAACFVRNVVLEVGLAGGSSADRAGAGGMPDLREVPEFCAGVVAFGLEAVVAVAVTHQVVARLAAAALARSRASQGSIGMPDSCPGRSARPSRVASGMVRWPRVANIVPVSAGLRAQSSKFMRGPDGIWRCGRGRRW
jgi:hypothetical protein